MGLGKVEDLNESGFCKVFSVVINVVKGIVVKDVSVVIEDIWVNNCDVIWFSCQIVELVEYVIYMFNQFKSKDNYKNVKLKKLFLIYSVGENEVLLIQGIKIGKVIVNGMNFIWDFGNILFNVCNFFYFVQEVKNLVKFDKNFIIIIVDEKEMKELGMGVLLLVSVGSVMFVKLIVMEYKGGKKSDKFYVLVGKGIMFDIGGILLKLVFDMDMMKWDMCGVVFVFGIMKVVLEMELLMNVIGVVVVVENMFGGKVICFGDIVIIMLG